MKSAVVNEIFHKGECPTQFLPFSAPWVGEEEIHELLAAVRSGWLTAGPRTRRFEQAFQVYVGATEAVATSSCTAALHLALRALDIGPGDAVLTSPFTFAATANVIVHCGAEVAFADICPQTFNLDPTAVARFLSERCRRSRPAAQPIRHERRQVGERQVEARSPGIALAIQGGELRVELAEGHAAGPGQAKALDHGKELRRPERPEHRDGKESRRHQAGVAPDLKWPNDLLLGGRKMGGILTEMHAEPGAIRFVIIGIGLNVNQAKFPDELATIATSLRAATGRTHSRLELLMRLLRQFESDYNRFLREGPAWVVEAFQAVSSFARGKHVRVSDGREEYTGTTAGLSAEGLLLVRREDGRTVAVLSGDVTEAV
ncbi:MAG: biotin--[acetyl-CoA-carboxylase] ligase [Acidobacteriia bacterium]|nr:biotin--[acetyl-CoA-carboxylase] ligase [Terriglobia bacterium]